MSTTSTVTARNARGVQTDGRSPEELRDLVSHWGAELELAPAEVIIEWAAATFGERFCVTSSMGDGLLSHLVSKVVPGVDVVFLDTGYHFVETIGTRDAVEATLDVNLLSITPVQSVAEQDATYGKDLYRTDPDLCCKLRKVRAAGRGALVVRRLGHRPAPRRDPQPGHRAGHRLGRQEGQGQGRRRSPAGATSRSSATPPRTACWSTRWPTTATPRSAARRAPGASPPATTPAAAAGPAPRRPSAGSTRDPRPEPPPHPDPERQRRRPHPEHRHEEAH